MSDGCVSSVSPASPMRDSILEFINRNPGIGRRKIVAALGCTDFAAAKVLKKWHADHGTTPSHGGTPDGQRAVRLLGSTPGSTELKPKTRVSVSDFCGRFDYAAKLREVVGKLCRNQFVAEVDIRANCDIPVTVFRHVADLPEFRSCQIKDGGTTWWSTAANVETARRNAKQWGISK